MGSVQIFNDELPNWILGKKIVSAKTSYNTLHLVLDTGLTVDITITADPDQDEDELYEVWID